MSGVVVRPAASTDHTAIRDLLKLAFGGADEAKLVDDLRRDGDIVLELVAVADREVVGHVLFSRLMISGENDFAAVALAPLAVSPRFQKKGIGAALVSSAHDQLAAAGERLSIVLGDTAYYGRFGYEHGRAAEFECQYQGEHLQARAFGEAPRSGELIYAPAFGTL